MGDAPDDDDKLLCRREQKAALEAANGVEQLRYIEELIDRGVTDLRESHVLELHSLAIADIYGCGGRYRTAVMDVRIRGSAHRIPEAALVPNLVRDAIDSINERRGNAVERAAYALWRLNWIHPFAGGNGRTSRALAYLLVCAENGSMLPGVPTMPSIIHEWRGEYIAALQATDRSVLGADGELDLDRAPDLQTMADYLERVLTKQLAHAINRLAGREPVGGGPETVH